MKLFLISLLLCLTCSAQQQLMLQGTSAPVANTNMAELADTFVIGADANLNTHTTTTGGYAWHQAWPAVRSLRIIPLAAWLETQADRWPPTQ